MIIPLILANQARLSVKKRPSAVNPNPSRKKVKLIPITKDSVFTRIFLLG